jgi:hypothetical protein
MPLTVSPNAPRFHTLWEHNERRRIFAIKRGDWESLNLFSAHEEQLILLDLSQIQPLPLGSLLEKSRVIRGAASISSSKVTIKIYRNDPKDEPTPINVDTYTVWFGLPPYLDVPRMIIAGDTTNNANFNHYANDHVFFVKENPQADHWLEELPKDVFAVFLKV